MELTLDQALQQAVTAHRQGKLQEAERSYRAILQVQPNHPEANHNLGVLAVAVGKAIDSLTLFKRALDANPQIEQFWLSYIDALIKSERFDEANLVLVEAGNSGVSPERLESLHQQIQIPPLQDKENTKQGQTLSEKRKAQAASSNVEPSLNQRNHLLQHYQTGRFEEAEALAKSITHNFPEHPFGWKALGAVLQQTGRFRESVAPMQSAVRLSPQDAEAHYNLGTTLQELGRLDDAEASHTKAIALEPNYAIAHNNLGNTLRALGRLAEAEARLRQAIALVPDFAEAHYNLGSTLQELSRLDEAEANYERAIALKPDYAKAHNNLGNTQRALGRLDEAEASLKEAKALRPDYAEAHNNLGVTLKELGRLNEAEDSYRHAITLKPDYAAAKNNLGVVLREMGKLDEAEASYRQAVALEPDYAEAHYNLGNTLKELGGLDEAEISLRQAVAHRPDYAEAHNNLGVTLKELGRLDEAEDSYRHAITLKPDYATAHNNLGVALKELGRLDEAEASLGEAIGLKPDFAEAHNNIGVALQGLGKLNEAEQSYRQAIALDPGYAEAHRNLVASKNFSSGDKQFTQMQALYLDPNISENDRCHICFALARASEDLEAFAAAFQFYEEGNALRKEQLGYHKAHDQKLFEKVKANYPRVHSYSLESDIHDSKHVPIFIVGVPRSGTTLAEHIISSHTLVTGAGELPFASQFGRAIAVGQTPANVEELTTFRGRYLEALQQRSEGKKVVIDKTPNNFQLLGLITAALPEAKIIHVKRDAAAVCWANYTQYFVSNSLKYCYGLDDILHYYELYRDLMKYWHQALPNRIYDLDYEVFTENQEEETRKLIGHLGLEWDDACLSPQNNKRVVSTASNIQVRKKVYQGSSELWKRYQTYLNGALDHLSAKK